jgi:hypothetical protein
MSSTSALRSELKATLWPYAERTGFTRGKATSLFTPFRRQAGDLVQVFDVQWDKSHRPRFVINFGDASVSELLQRKVVDDAGSIEVHHCPEMLRLQRRRGGAMSCWFQLRRRLLERIMTLSWNYTPAEVAAAAMANFAEIEAWWSNRTVGPHVSVLRTRSSS